VSHRRAPIIIKKTTQHWSAFFLLPCGLFLLSAPGIVANIIMVLFR
jgi:hypothetical protein